MSVGVEIDCMYSCAVCGISKAHVKVPARLEGEGIREWLEQVAGVALAEDHERRSPGCHPNTLSEVYIPTTGAKFIGGPSVQ
jgi:hypothetical protein